MCGRRGNWPTVTGLLTLFLALLATGNVTYGQQPGSKTGRHLPTAVELPVVNSKPALEHSPHWHLSLSAGNQWGGDLFRVQVRNGVAVPWAGLGSNGFQTSRFRAKIDDNTGFGAAIARDFKGVWRLRLDLAKAELDVLASALVGQGGGVFLYDKFQVTTLGVSLERDLVDLLSAPYVGIGINIVHLAPTANAELDQTNVGSELTMGYRQDLGGGKNLFLEGRLVRTSLSQGSFSPAAKPPFSPEVEVDFQNQLIFFSIKAGFRLAI